jgi:hypothetical protein
VKNPERIAQRHDRASHIRRDYQRHYDRHHHRRDFWRGHPNWARYRFHQPYRWATWGALTGWFGWGSGGSNYYYDYGRDVYYDDGYVYYGDEQAASSEQYAEQAMTIADAGVQELDQASEDDTADQTEWMSLGVFALTNAEKGDATMYLQLAVSKDGTIAGTYFNSSTDQTQTVQGSVDKKTQRAAWTVGDNGQTVLEAGIYNLTKDETPVLVHFGTEKTQQWLLVRLEDPEKEKGTEDS